jgi:sulfur carrier protein
MDKITIYINGKQENADKGTTVAAVLQLKGIKNPMIVVEKNLEIIPREFFDNPLNDGDKIEILSIFGGG